MRSVHIIEAAVALVVVIVLMAVAGPPLYRLADRVELLRAADSAARVLDDARDWAISARRCARVVVVLAEPALLSVRVDDAPGCQEASAVDDEVGELVRLDGVRVVRSGRPVAVFTPDGRRAVSSAPGLTLEHQKGRAVGSVELTVPTLGATCVRSDRESDDDDRGCW